jgi:transcriptional regulator with XRE-family HTH domain
MKEIIKDTERQDRLNQVYRHLFAHFNIVSQTKFADALHVQRTALSAAMNGNKAYLTNNLFTKICAAFPGVFNYEYLTTGVGSLLSIKEDVKSEEINKGSHQILTPMDISILIEKAVEKATAYAEKALAAQERNIKMLEDKNRALEERNRKLDERIRELEALNNEKSIFNSPFPVGVADDRTSKHL